MGVLKDLFTNYITKMRYYGENIKKLYGAFDDFNEAVALELDKVYSYNLINECPADAINDRFKWIIPQGGFSADVYRDVLKAVINILIRGLSLNNLKVLLDVFSNNYSIYENSVSGLYLGEEEFYNEWILGQGILGVNTWLGSEAKSYVNTVEIIFKDIKAPREDIERVLLKIKPLWQVYFLVYDLNNRNFVENWSYIVGSHINRYIRYDFIPRGTIGGYGADLFYADRLQDGLLDSNNEAAYYSVNGGSGNNYNNYSWERFDKPDDVESSNYNFVRIYKVVDENGDNVIWDGDDNHFIFSVRFMQISEGGSINIVAEEREVLNGKEWYDFQSDLMFLRGTVDISGGITFDDDEELWVKYYDSLGQVYLDSVIISAGVYTAVQLRDYLNSNLQYTRATLYIDVDGSIYIQLNKGYNLSAIKKMAGYSNSLGVSGESFSGTVIDVNSIGLLFKNWAGDDTNDVNYYLREALFMKHEVISYNQLIKEEKL